MLAILVAAITIALVIERITYSFVTLIFHLFNQGSDKKSTCFISILFQNIVNLLATTIASLFRLFSFSVRGLLWIAILLMIRGVAYVCARHSIDALLAFQHAYNSNIGGTFLLAIVLLMQLLKLICEGLIPLYNLIVYCIKTIPTRVLLENVLRNLSDFENCVLNLGMFSKTLTQSLVNYVELIVRPPDSFDPNLRLLDLITPLAYWCLTVSYMLAWIGEVCSIASSLVDIIAYPMQFEV